MHSFRPSFYIRRGAETSKGVLPHELQPPPEKHTCFALPSTPEELLQASKGVLPENTLRNDQWAYRVFDQWVKEGITICEEDCCQDDLMKTSDAELLGKWLVHFIMEVCKKDGSKDPPSTIHLIHCGLQWIMHRSSNTPFNLFDKKDVRFHGFRGTMETVFQQLHSKGVRAKRNHAQRCRQQHLIRSQSGSPSVSASSHLSDSRSRGSRPPYCSCTLWNIGSCIYPRVCTYMYSHVCSICHQAHHAKDCPDALADSFHWCNSRQATSA